MACKFPVFGGIGEVRGGTFIAAVGTEQFVMCLGAGSVAAFASLLKQLWAGDLIGHGVAKPEDTTILLFFILPYFL